MAGIGGQKKVELWMHGEFIEDNYKPSGLFKSLFFFSRVFYYLFSIKDDFLTLLLNLQFCSHPDKLISNKVSYLYIIYIVKIYKS